MRYGQSQKFYWLTGVILTLASIFVYQREWLHMTHIMVNSGTYSHTLFAPFLVVILVYSRYKQLKSRGGKVYPTFDGSGVFLLFLSALLYLVAQLMSLSVVGHISVIVALWAIALIMLGRKNFHFFAYSLFGLIFLVPFGDILIPKLQVISASGAVWLMQLFGVSVTHDGVFMHFAHGAYEVARACSGLNFLTVSVMMGYFLSCLLFERRYDRIRVMLMAVIIPVIANIVRVVSVVIIAEYISFDFAMESSHFTYGWVFLSIISFVLLSYIYRIAPKDLKVHLPHSLPPVTTIVPAIVSAIILLAVWGLDFMIHSAARTSCDHPDIRVNASSLRPLEVGVSDLEWLPIFKGADQRDLKAFRMQATRYDIRHYFYSEQQTGAELLSSANIIAGKSLRLQPNSQMTVTLADGKMFEEGLLIGQNQKRLFFVEYYVDHQRVSSRLAARWSLLIKRLQGVNASAAMILYSVSLSGDNKQLAREQLSAFIRDVQYGRVTVANCVTQK